MDRLKAAMEDLDKAIFELEDRIGLDHSSRQETLKKQSELVKTSRVREGNVLAAAQKVAARLDQVIEHVENIVRH
jgi:hypothetical protein